jgi:LysM repeat protein
MTHCVWLGSQKDASTHFAYPIAENQCCAPNGPRLLELAHQTRWCLTDDHSACSFFVSPDSLPANDLAEWTSTDTSGRRIRLGWITAGGVVLVLLIIAVLVSIFGQNQTHGDGIGSANLVTAAVTSTPTVRRTQPTPTIESATRSPTATETPLATSTASPTPLTYTVQPGDTLSKIATRFGISVTAIAEANNIKDPTRIKTGAVLIIPPKFAPTKTPVP